MNNGTSKIQKNLNICEHDKNTLELLQPGGVFGERGIQAGEYGENMWPTSNGLAFSLTSRVGQLFDSFCIFQKRVLPRPGVRLQHLTDDQLVARLRLGGSEAFAELYTRFHSRVYRFALKLLGERNLAEDIAQDVFLKAQKGITTLSEGALVRPWLLSIARNEVYAHFRKTRRNGQAHNEGDLWVHDGLDEQIVRNETVEIVQQMIALLKPEYREVLLLREYEQLSYSEIARVTGDTESSVKSRLFKARKALLGKLKPYFGGKE